MLLLAETRLPTLLFLGLLGVVIVLLLTRSQRSLGRSAPGRADRGPLPPTAATVSAASSERLSPAHHLDSPEEVRRWEVEMHEIARKLSATLETKSALLDHLIREADRATERLEAALNATRGNRSDLPGAPTEADRHAGGQAAGLDGMRTEDRPDQGRRLRDLSPRERSQEIYALADSGHSAAEIAGRTGVPIGEVQLILSIRRAPGESA